MAVASAARAAARRGRAAARLAIVSARAMAAAAAALVSVAVLAAHGTYCGGKCGDGDASGGCDGCCGGGDTAAAAARGRDAKTATKNAGIAKPPR